MYGLVKKKQNIPFVEQEPISTFSRFVCGIRAGPRVFRVLDKKEAVGSERGVGRWKDVSD